MGKSLGTDLDGGKMTLPLIHLYQRLDPRGRADLREVLESPALTDRRAELLRRFDLAPDLLHAREAARGHARQAVEAMQTFAPGRVRDGLIGACDYVVHRDL